MRTVIAAIGLAAVVLLTGTAQATLVVTDGAVRAFNVDTAAGFRGDGFSVGVSLRSPALLSSWREVLIQAVHRRFVALRLSVAVGVGRLRYGGVAELILCPPEVSTGL
jgi:hypothetical protein